MTAFVGWLQRHADGVFWGTYRCEKWGPHEASLHAEGRAVDWHLDVADPADRHAARAAHRALPGARPRRHRTRSRAGWASRRSSGTARTGAPGCRTSTLPAVPEQARRARASTSTRPPGTATTSTSGSPRRALRRTSYWTAGPRPASLDLLDQHRHALADADAQRREAAARRPRAPGGRAGRSRARTPRAPSGWPSAIAPPSAFTRLRVEAEPADARERLRRERLVELDRVEVVDVQPGALEDLLGRRAPGRGP